MRPLLILLACLGLASTLFAAQANVVTSYDPTREVEVTTTVPIPRAAHAGWVPVEVILQNKTERSLRRELTFRSGNSWDHNALSTLSVELGPNERRTLDLLIPYFGAAFGENIRLEIQASSNTSRSTIYSVDSSSSNKSTLPMLMVTSAGFAKIERFTGQTVQWDAVQSGQGSSHYTTQSIGVLADELPEDWRSYSTLSVVVIDLDAPLPSRAAMDALVRWVGLGGTLAFFGSEPTRATELLASAGVPMQDRFLQPMPSERTVELRHGFGRIVIPNSPNSTTNARTLLGFDSATSVPTSIIPRTFLAMPPALPGVGLPPLSLLTAMLILVAAALGPIQFEQLKRRKAKPWRFLVITPILGIGFAIILLGFSLLSQGTGIRESVQSVTWLDQERKVASTIAGRTSFSGSLLAQSQRFGNEAVVVPAMLGSGSSDEYVYRVDLTRDYALSGHFMPTRIPASTALAASQSARAGLRIETENGSVFAMHDFEQDLLRLRYRDAAGDFYRPVEDRDVAPGERVLLEKVDQIFEVRLPVKASPPPLTLNYGLKEVADTNVGINYLRLPHLPPILPTRTWMAEVDRSPFLPDGGLRRTEEASAHVILGQLEAQS